MDFIHPKANEYVDQYSNATPSYLRAMYDATMASHPHAHLQSNWNQGGFLTFFSRMLQPLQIIEIGTFTGFSSLCLAEGLQKEGQLHTIELREQDAQSAKSYFEQSAFNNQIIQYIGDAKTLIPSIDKVFDLAFIDADKTGYIDYYEMLLPKMASGGIMIADNTLFHGEVLQSQPAGKSAKAIQAFNDYVIKDTRTEKLMLTIRDGLTLIRIK